MKNSRVIYEKRIKKYEVLAKKQREFTNFLSAIRLIIFAAGLIFAAYFLYIKQWYLSSGIFIISLMIFVLSVIKFNNLTLRRKYSIKLREINEKYLMRTTDEWKSFRDNGEDFKDDEHNYSGDLDTFGTGSLYQYISSANTNLGRRKLAEILTSIPEAKDEILRRQEAIKELSYDLGWRQKFLADSSLFVDELYDPSELFSWGETLQEEYFKPWLRWIVKIIPIITILLIAGYFFTSRVPYFVPLLFLAVNFLLLKANSNNRTEKLNTIFKYKKNIKMYERMILDIEKRKFKSSYLSNLREKFISENKLTASKQIKKLSRISDFISDRSNLYYTIINVIGLFDYQLMIALEQWKKDYGENLRKWIESISELEAFSSLANISYDNPEWVTPKIIENENILEAKKVGHPLIGDKRVCNDISIGGTSNILLITGSNMSGKSTYLRTSGINLVLAYAGSVVCAESFTCSIMGIYTCMRISDNLEKNISSFYAEILKVKNIVKAAESGERIYVLLDEIFKGTNSVDRHTGARVLINKLCRYKVIGMVSTHDLELGDIENKNEEVKNYHLREFYKDNKIYFDYKLREGVSTTRNALFLMKLAGIDIDENK